ncbi:GNAT family N-acetyltransferase [Modestobacter sp. NPDC049651]|uniref:GNAT family N-acetyltransferase n=1 Tax=unclassified Modestobacter TaxID=2643866 RepID=UPI0033F54165
MPSQPSGAARRPAVARAARPDDLPAVLALVRRHTAEHSYESVLTGQGAGAADGFTRLLTDPAHRVVVAELPDGGCTDGGCTDGGGTDGGGTVVGLAVLGTDALAAVLGCPQVTVDWFVVHPDHRHRGIGCALLAAAAAHARAVGAEHVSVAVGGQDAERQRFFARRGFAPLATRRIAGVAQLTRGLAGARPWAAALPAPRRPLPRRRSARVPLPELSAD